MPFETIEGQFWEDLFVDILQRYYGKILYVNNKIFVKVKLMKKVRRKKIYKVFKSKGKQLGYFLSEIWRWIVPRDGKNNSGDPKKVKFDILSIRSYNGKKPAPIKAKFKYPKVAYIKKKNGVFQKIKITKKNRENYIYRRRKVKGKETYAAKRRV